MADQTPNEFHIQKLQERREEINKVSPSFCLAKWLQSTVYLHNGMTHSCHHPTPHKIPLEEVQKDPSALHNTSFKNKVRDEMLDGKFPKECQYCWNIENLGKSHFSDRHYKSADEWAFPHLEKVKASQNQVAPTYLEVAFEYLCNFKCAYCTPDISSKWMEEIRRHGPYPTSTKTGNLQWIEKTGRTPIAKSEDNPYIEAFWKWWPQIYDGLHTFRITGGEPLLSQNTWKVFEYISQKPQKKLNFAINTNMGVSDILIDRLIGEANTIYDKVHSFEIYTSCEAAGKQAEYTRYGIDYTAFLKNIEKYLSQTPSDSRVNIMITFNLLSLPSFNDFLMDIWKLREKYNQTDSLNRIPIMINYLRWPKFLSMTLAPRELKERYRDIYLNTVRSYSRNQRPGKPGRFYLEEINQVERLCDFMMTEPDDPQFYHDFGLFIQEYDRRRKTNFAETFPELKEFYERCL